MRLLPETALWTVGRFPEAVEALLARTGHALEGSRISLALTGAEHVASWLREAPRAMGFEALTAEVSADDLERRLLGAREPLFVVFGRAGEARGLSILPERGGRVRLLSAEGEHVVARNRVARVLRDLARRQGRLQELFAGLPRGYRAYERLADAEPLVVQTFLVATFYLDAAHPLPTHLRALGAGRLLGWSLAVSLLQAALAAAAAWTLGASALLGRLDLGRVIAWGMLAASDAPLLFLGTALLGRFSVALGITIKRRLLEGTFAIDEAEIRKQGYGAIVARLSEAATVERISPREILGALVPVLQIVLAASLLAVGVWPLLLELLLAAFVGGTAALSYALSRAYTVCYAQRLRLTEDLVEKILGHRTRIAQDNAKIQHDDEDAALQEYLRSSVRLDTLTALSAILGRLWILFAGLSLVVAFVQWADTSAMLFTAIGIGIANLGVTRLAAAMRLFVGWYSAWRGVRPLLDAGRQRERPARTGDVVDAAGLSTVLTISSLSFAYARALRPVLVDASLSVAAGEKILIEGPSGSGKTTLAKLIAGELRPTSGTSLVQGLDVHALSQSEWRRRVASSPQFHENHVFTNTFAFNLDPNGFGRARGQLAVEICRELGLEDLLRKMPQGSFQLLGEVGWQLSHGERSRLFIARSLLQGADIMLFDESFGALDPETLEQTIECVRRRAKTLIVIAHT